MITLLIVGAYLFGSVPVGVLVGRAFGFDPRTVGSGNIGMTNVARAGGRTAAAITFAGDFLKGFLPVLLVRKMGLPHVIMVSVGFAAFLGAIASIFLLFRGGRGVATSVGVWIGLAPLPLGISILVFVVILASTRIVSLSSIGAAVALPPSVAAFGCPRPYILLAIVMAALVLFRHHENIRRLISGEERRLGSPEDGPRSG